ncbi:hypothetical protein AWENTII_001115 [Aspergillus wentii]|nr:hypothetical protein MW887_001590 [Aspergillus wentii]
MHRKIELQSPADFTYLYANTVAASRQKLDLHLPPSATNNDEPDPMRERYILKTFTTASSSISINGLDSSSPQFPFPAAFTTPTETVEYEAYDTNLAARVTSLYAQLESLTTSVAQLRRDAPRRAARAYADQLKLALEGDEDENEDGEGEGEGEGQEQGQAQKVEGDVQMPDADGDEKPSASTATQSRKSAKEDWKLQVPLGTQHEAERWRNGEMAEVYEDALRTLLRLQGDADDADANADGGAHNALATTVGKAERAGRAAEVVENM